MSKMRSHHPFAHLKHKLWPKEGLGVKLTIWLQPLKVGNRPDFLPCMGRATYLWKALNEGYNFASNLITIGGLHAKLWRPKVIEVPTLAISGLPLGSLGTKSHLDMGLMGNHRVYYKGEGGGFPQVWAMVSLVSPNCPWLVLAPKVFQLCTNHFVFVLCRPVWVSKACQFFLVPSRSSSTTFYPSKVLRVRERAPTPCPSVFFVWDSHLNPSRSWECVKHDHEQCAHAPKKKIKTTHRIIWDKIIL
jgi:hypothetical protein